jgi:hypothetical protein
VDDSLPFTPDSADVSHDDIRLLDPTQQDGYRPRGDQHFPRASRAWEVRHQPRRSPADKPEAPWAPGLPVHDLQPRRSAQTAAARKRVSAPAVPARRAAVRAREAADGTCSVDPGRFLASRVVEVTEVFRREHPPPPENAYYISSSEDNDCKYPDPMGERAPNDGDDKEAWLQRQEARREMLAKEAARARYVGEHVPVF